MHEATKACRFSGRAASEKPRDQVQPPSEISTFRPGWRALSCLSWFQLPRSGWSQVSAVPVTLSPAWKDRKSTRLNSSHVKISYAVFCLKKKKQPVAVHTGPTRTYTYRHAR